MTELLIACIGAAGVHLIWSALVIGDRSFRRPSAANTQTFPERTRRWLRQAGLPNVSVAEFAAVSAAIGALGCVVGWLLFAGPAAALFCGAFASTFPFAGYKSKRAATLTAASEAWPRMLEEIRLKTGSLGRSIPQALFESGARAPDAMVPAFEAAHREWLLTRDFAKTTALLRDELSDPTADAACETLLVAHELGGADLDARLSALAEDRRQDVLDRKDAASKQAGVRFARKFVLLVPIGMALAGMSVGNGRAAYSTGTGQVMVLVGVLTVIACWLWSGRIMRLPSENRVFDR